MSVEPGVHAQNRAATERLRAFAGSLTAAELRQRVGDHWTVAVVFAHLAFWDRRVLDVLARTERAGMVEAPEVDVVTNDLALPFWLALPPADAVRLAVESAVAVDARLAALPPALLDVVESWNPRWVRRSMHRTTHLDEAERALGRMG